MYNCQNIVSNMTIFKMITHFKEQIPISNIVSFTLNVLVSIASD